MDAFIIWKSAISGKPADNIPLLIHGYYTREPHAYNILRGFYISAGKKRGWYAFSGIGKKSKIKHTEFIIANFAYIHELPKPKY